MISLGDEQADFRDLHPIVAEKLFKALSEDTQEEDQHPADVALAIYEERSAAGGKLSGVPIGIDAFDSQMGGLQPGTLTIYGGRSSHGKSTVAQDSFYNAGKNDIPCLYVSLEQPSADTFLFLLQKEMGIAPLNIKQGSLSPTKEYNLRTGLKRLKAHPFYFYDLSSRLDDILLKARSMAQTNGIKLLIVDYIQLVENPTKGEARHLQVAGVSRALKRLAMDTNLAIIALSQLNKGPEDRNGRISLSDVRESEAITHDADHVIFINRPSLYGNDEKDFLRLAKNRHGRTIDKIHVHWNEERNTYLPLT
jgi:replicative DNA helicase